MISISGKIKANEWRTTGTGVRRLLEDRGATCLQALGVESSIDGFINMPKVSEDGFGSIYNAFFPSAWRGQVILGLKRLSQHKPAGEESINRQKPIVYRELRGFSVKEIEITEEPVHNNSQIQQDMKNLYYITAQKFSKT
jgi:hypothetical protein